MELSDINKIWFTDDAIHIETKDGRKGIEQFADYPNLKSASQKQRENYTTSAFGIHWEELNEDLSFDGFLSQKWQKLSAN